MACLTRIVRELADRRCETDSAPRRCADRPPPSWRAAGAGPSVYLPRLRQAVPGTTAWSGHGGERFHPLPAEAARPRSSPAFARRWTRPSGASRPLSSCHGARRRSRARCSNPRRALCVRPRLPVPSRALGATRRGSLGRSTRELSASVRGLPGGAWLMLPASLRPLLVAPRQHLRHGQEVCCAGWRSPSLRRPVPFSCWASVSGRSPTACRRRAPSASCSCGSRSADCPS